MLHLPLTKVQVLELLSVPGFVTGLLLDLGQFDSAERFVHLPLFSVWLVNFHCGIFGIKPPLSVF